MDTPVIATLFVALMCAGCGSNPPRGDAQDSTRSPGTALTDSTWRLAAFSEADARSAELEETEITAVFTPEGRVAGSAGCNRYFGAYEPDGTALTISGVGATRMACLPPVMEMESRFLSALESVKGWKQQSGTLDLFDGSGTRLLRFVFASSGEETAGRMEPQETGKNFVFDCTDSEGEAFSFTVRTGPGELALWLPERFGGRYLVLGQTRAASGARYEGDGVVVWNKGEEAILEINAETFTGCKLDPQP